MKKLLLPILALFAISLNVYAYHSSNSDGTWSDTTTNQFDGGTHTSNSNGTWSDTTPNQFGGGTHTSNSDGTWSNSGGFQ
jgi:hypothetical protein